jgi:hypothetical protein
VRRGIVKRKVNEEIEEKKEIKVNEVNEAKGENQEMVEA